MPDSMDSKREQISALMDGQLRAHGLAQAVQLACEDAQAHQAWDEYHLIGQALRGECLDSSSLQSDFLTRLQARLKSETCSSLEPGVLQVEAKPLALLDQGSRHLQQEAANQPVYRWKLVAGLAGIATVALLAWNAMGLGQPATGLPQLAEAPQTLASPLPAGGPATMGQALMLRDPQLDRFLAAHKQQGGGSALQLPAGFLRNATFDHPSR